jgi:GDP-4-dehydro-6-deoxy-D-mannose reductase
MKKAFITGITGFAGSFLAERLIDKGVYEVSGTYLTDNNLTNIRKIQDKIGLYKIDLQDGAATEKIIADVRPDVIFHLAALTAPGDSFKNPVKFINNNISIQVNIFEAVRSANIAPIILVVSTAEIYGYVDPSDIPIDEKTPLRPANPYAVSKAACDLLAFQYFLSYKLPIIRVRPFNHIGPRQAPSFAVAAFSKKIAEIEKDKTKPVLTVGNLDAKRDFTDVRDMVEAYIGIVEKGAPGEAYNAGRGSSVQIKQIVEMLLSYSKEKITVEVDPSLLRPIDIPEFVCDNTKIKKEIGWEPKIPIEKTLKDTLDYWRSMI